MITLHNQQITVSRIELIRVMKSNKLKHVEEYNAANAVYPELMIKKLKATIKDVQKGKVKELNVRLAAPVSKEQDYQEVIEMLEASVDDNITLDKQSFQAFYKDQWSWTSSFKATVASYISGDI